jgi:ribosome-associated translation inhibitor RaiA
MKIVMCFRGLNARASWRGLVEAQLKRLQGLAAISFAQVTLEWRNQVRPAFRVLTLLEVPGPDFHAEATDHTVQAALLKVVKNLERQMRFRKNRRAERFKSNPRLGLVPARASAALTAFRA